MKIHGSCHCGFIKFEAEADPAKVTMCHCTDCQQSTGTAFRTNVPVDGKTFKTVGLHQDDGRERHAARADLLPEMRHADLFDHAGAGTEGGLHGARGNIARARSAAAEAADLVALGAAVGDQYRYVRKIPEGAAVNEPRGHCRREWITSHYSI